MPVFEHLEAVSLFQDRVLMPGIGRRDLSRGDLHNTQPDGDEHLDLITGAEGFIGLVEDLCRGLSEHGAALQNDLGNHHEQGCRNAFPADIRHDHAQMIIVDQEEVVEITPDLLGRIHRRIQVKLPPVREGRENMRQHAALDQVGHLQFRADAFLFPRYLLDLFYIEPCFP